MNETTFFVKACDHCDLLNEVPEVTSGFVAKCMRCNSTLYKSRGDKLNHALAFAISGLIAFAIANIFPLLTFSLQGREYSSKLLDGTWILFSSGFPFLGILVFLFSFFVPLVVLILLIHMLVLKKFDIVPDFVAFKLRILKVMKTWAMAEIFVFSIMIAYVKLVDLATITLGLSLVALFATVVFTILAYVYYDDRLIWRWLREHS